MRDLIKWMLLLVLIGSMFVAIGQNTSLTQYFKETISTNEAPTPPIVQENLNNSVILPEGLVASDCDTDNKAAKENIEVKQASNKSLYRKTAALNAEFREKGYNESARVITVNNQEVIQVVKTYNKEDLPIQVTKTK